MNPIEFAHNLFALRMERKMTVEELADALNLTPEVICAWECAKTSPTLEQMNRLSRLYGISLDEIIRNPKPHDEIPLPPPVVEKESVPQEEIIPSEPVSPPPLRRKREKKPSATDILILLLLLAIIATALVFLFRPEWFPFLPASDLSVGKNLFLLR